MKLIAIFALLAVTALAASKPIVERVHRNGHHLDHTLPQLPNLKDAAGMRTMKCSTCKAVAGDLWTALEPVRAAQIADPRPDRKFRYTEVIENFCTHIDNKYGLQLNADGKATHTMTGDSSAERLRGLWTNHYAKTECAKIMRDSEEHILHNMLAIRGADTFTKDVCGKWAKMC